MRMLTAAAGAALLILAASPALAGGPTGGGHPGGGRPGPCCGHPGGGVPNVNVNVNASASASAQAFAGASAVSHFNARAFDVGGVRGRSSGGVIYTGGGYAGDVGGYYGGPVYYNEVAWDGYACASAPFGYVVTGFGRDDRYPPTCGREDQRDRGGRYGYRERHDRYEESRYESYESYEEYGAWEGGHERRDCDCRHDDRAAPYPPAYLPEPPAPPRVREHRRPRPSQPPRQQYRQEPGERG